MQRRINTKMKARMDKNKKLVGTVVERIKGSGVITSIQSGPHLHSVKAYTRRCI